jgi:hypothetical protein
LEKTLLLRTLYSAIPPVARILSKNMEGYTWRYIEEQWIFQGGKRGYSMKIKWSDVTIPQGGLPDGVRFADDRLRSSTAYSASGKFIQNNRMVFRADIEGNDYRQEFTDRTWRKPHDSKNLNHPEGTTHILSYDMEFPHDYVPHPSKIVIAQGHTAGIDKSPIWTLGLWSDDLRVQAMAEDGSKVYGYPQKGQMLLSTHAYGFISSSGSMIANRFPLPLIPKAGQRIRMLIIRKAALKKNGGFITMYADGKLLFHLNADMVHPDELLCDNWKVGIYYPDIKTDSITTKHPKQAELVNQGYKTLSYSIGDFNVAEIIPSNIVDDREVARVLNEYWMENANSLVDKISRIEAIIS